MILIAMTPEQFAAKAADLKAKEGIDISGDTGTITKSTPLGKVVANYFYDAGKLGVTVVKHPFGISGGECEQDVAKWLNS